MKFLLIITVLYWDGTAEVQRFDAESELICNLMGATGGIMYEGDKTVRKYSWTCSPKD